MRVACRLWLWSVRDGASDPEAYSSVEDAVVGVGGSLVGRWSATIAAHRAAPRESAQPGGMLPARDLHVVSLSDAADRLILVARSEGKVLEAAGAAKSLLDSYGLYKHRAALQLEGAAYIAGDFRITLTRATSRPDNNFRGLVIDAEYQPLAVPAAAAPALAELGELLREAAEAAVPGARFLHVEEGHAGFGLPEAYSSQHFAVSLVQLMTTLS